MPDSILTPALNALRAGRMLVLTDDADREDEGDLCMAACHIAAHDVAFMARHGRGLICAPMSAARADALALPPMVPGDALGTSAAFAVSCDARTQIASGISAADRARTLQVMASPHASAADLVRPGHLFGLRGRAGGVLERPGHTEGCLDLLALAGQGEVGVLCEVVNDDGTTARAHDLRALAQAHDLPIVQIIDILAYRLAAERWVHVVDGLDPANAPLQVHLEGVQVTARWAQGTGDPHALTVIDLDGPGAPRGGEGPNTLQVAVTLSASCAALPRDHSRLLALGLAAQAARARGCVQVTTASPLDARAQALWLALGLTLGPV